MTAPTVYTQLGSDEEWLIGVQPTARPTLYHFAIVRDGIILLQGDFDLKPGEDLSGRMRMAIQEWKTRPSTWHTLFHKTCKKMDTRIGSACVGACPWVCLRSNLRAVAESWSWIVPGHLRRAGCQTFRAWASPPSEIQKA